MSTENSKQFFFVKSNENTYPKRRALVQMYRVVPITKRGNSQYNRLTVKVAIPIVNIID